MRRTHRSDVEFEETETDRLTDGSSTAHTPRHCLHTHTHFPLHCGALFDLAVSVIIIIAADFSPSRKLTAKNFDTSKIICTNLHLWHDLVHSP